MKREIVYISTGTPFLKKAHAIQTLFTCKNLSSFFNVVLLYPLTISTLLKMRSLKKLYRKNNVKLILLPTTSFGVLFRNKFLFLIDRLIFSFMTFMFVSIKSSDKIITRDNITAWLLSKFKKIILELHDLEFVLDKNSVTKHFEKVAILRSYAVVTRTLFMEGCVKNFNKNVYFIPNGFENSLFRVMKTPKEKNKILIVYSGFSLREDMGIDVLIKSLDFLNLENAEILIIGGDKKIKLKGVNFIGSVEIKKVPYYLNMADVLVLPYKKSEFTEYFTSPLKLFEYMAVKKPIVATKVGCFNGILKDGYNCILVEPGNPKSLAEGIKRVIGNKRLAEKIAKNAYGNSKKYTYKNRAKKIKGIIEDLSQR